MEGDEGVEEEDLELVEGGDEYQYDDEQEEY